MKVRWLFMTNLYPKENEQAIRSKLKYNMYDAANNLQWNILYGMNENGVKDMDVYNLLPVDSYPSGYTDWYVNGFDFSEGFCGRGKNVPFFNVKYLKRLFLNHPFVSYSKKWARENPDAKVLIYSLHSTFLTAVKKMKQKNPSIKAYAIVADLPQFTSPTGNFIRRAFSRHNTKKIYSLLKYIDGFVLLTDQMAEKLNITQPHVVMEGIAPRSNTATAQQASEKEKNILYTGSMNSKYGILTLLEAFKQTQNENYRLILCGLGDAEGVIAEHCANDKRISYLGKVKYEDVLALQRSATVLVNPRQNIEEFTKYSFPSKTMEYLASGTPVVAYKLDGIPDEYDEYINYVPDNSPASLARKIAEICELPEEERRAMGAKGEKFVTEHKNAVAQTKKILDFIGAER